MTTRVQRRAWCNPNNSLTRSSPNFYMQREMCINYGIKNDEKKLPRINKSTRSKRRMTTGDSSAQFLQRVPETAPKLQQAAKIFAYESSTSTPFTTGNGTAPTSVASSRAARPGRYPYALIVDSRFEMSGTVSPNIWASTSLLNLAITALLNRTGWRSPPQLVIVLSRHIPRHPSGKMPHLNHTNERRYGYCWSRLRC